MTLAGLLAGWCGLVALLWAAIWAKARAESTSTPYRLAPSEGGRPPTGRTAVVVPARNEAANIERCVRSVVRDGEDGLTLTVLDDGSTDATPEILARLSAELPRLDVVSGGSDPVPDGWLGKPWACQRAAEVSLRRAPDWLLFVDADVALAPGAVGAAVAYLEAHELDLLSVMGTLELGSFWERAVQPAVVGLILAGNDLARVNDPERRPARPLANGQFLLFRRSAWERIGGHHAVKGAVIDDVGLATAVVQSGGAYHLVFGPQMFRCRMYTGLAEIWSGWTKNLFEGMDASWRLVGGLVAFVAGGVVLPWLVLPGALVAGELAVAAAAAAAVGAMVGARVHLDRRFGQDTRYAVTIPVGWTVLAAMAVASGVRFHHGGGTWKGRALPPGGG